MNNTAKNIFVGMSGGVDSSVAALLLKNQGHKVTGIFMKNWEEDDTDTYCPDTQDMADAQAVCDQLGIELQRVNFSSEYWEKVFSYFLTEYQAGRTPNPDILCNKEIKFKALLDYAKNQGADYIATGHYAKNEIINDENLLLKSEDTQKDQTYFLYALNQYQLAHSIFPLGNLEKPVIRQMAASAKFVTHNKKDSTGICFIGERKFKTFLEDYLPAQPGLIQTIDGDVIGHHDGLMFYTIGQRQGLKIGGNKNYAQEPWFVVKKDLATNTLIVVQGTNHPALFARKLIGSDLHWINHIDPTKEHHFTAKTRYRQLDQPCIINNIHDKSFEVTFTEPQRAITPGQSIVFYQGPICMGGGIIHEAIM